MAFISGKCDPETLGGLVDILHGYHFSAFVREYKSARSSKNSKSWDLSPLDSNVRALVDVGAGVAFTPLVLGVDMVGGLNDGRGRWV